VGPQEGKATRQRKEGKGKVGEERGEGRGKRTGGGELS